VDVLLLDKTGTITLGIGCGRFHAAPGVSPDDLQRCAIELAGDETPEGRSIVVLAKEKFGLRALRDARFGGDVCAVHSANTDERVDLHAQRLRNRKCVSEGAADAVRGLSNWAADFSAAVTKTVDEISHRVARRLSSRPTC